MGPCFLAKPVHNHRRNYPNYVGSASHNWSSNGFAQFSWVFSEDGEDASRFQFACNFCGVCSLGGDGIKMPEMVC